MAKVPTNLVALVELRTDSTIGNAVTSDDEHVLATDLKDSRIESFRTGIFFIAVEALDTTTGDETYSVKLIGRESDSGSYADLATISPTATGFHMTDVTDFDKQLNYEVDVGGTTPSITFSAGVLVTEATYQNLGGAVIDS